MSVPVRKGTLPPVYMDPPNAPPQAAFPQSAQGGQPFVVVQNNAVDDVRGSVLEGFNASLAKKFGVIQIVGGVLSIALGIGLIVLGSVAAFNGAIFWSGIVYIAAGSLGYSSGKYKTRCTIIAYMVLAIIASLSTIGIFATAATGITLEKVLQQWGMHIYKNHEVRDNMIPIALYGVLLAIGIVELITLIWGSALTCKVTCCRDRSRHAITVIQQTQPVTASPVGIYPTSN